jgi:type II secretory pathway pseudopilin PulG
MKKTKKQFAFTIVELLVAMGLLAVIMTASGFIFHNAIKSQRTAKATLEITQKLRNVTTQLDADFKNIRKNGEIFLVFGFVSIDSDNNGTIDADDRHDRSDKITFFANGDLHSYHQRNDNLRGNDIRGNVARVAYMLSTPDPQKPSERILARSQHIYTPEVIYEPGGVTSSIFPAPGVFDGEVNNWYEYDTMNMRQWGDIDYAEKMPMFSYITDLRILGYDPPGLRGLSVSPSVSPDDVDSIQMMLCQGMGSFSIQAWNDNLRRWIPEVNPDGDAAVDDDTDFVLNGSNIDYTAYIGLWHRDRYPNSIYGLYDPLGWPNWDGFVLFGDNWLRPAYSGPFNETTFNDIPGLGRAFKFTFTLYDSMDIFPDGKVFTHIVYLDD